MSVGARFARFGGACVASGVPFVSCRPLCPRCESADLQEVERNLYRARESSMPGGRDKVVLVYKCVCGLVFTVTDYPQEDGDED
jgi:hypothetical protein